jgi:hypothetical protein
MNAACLPLLFVPAWFTPTSQLPPHAKIEAGPTLPTIGFAQGIRSGDVDGDGDIDLIAGYSQPPRVYVFTNDNAGTFAPHAELSGWAAGLFAAPMTTADLDGDGDLDVAAASANGNAVTIFFNLGDGTYVEQSQIAVGTFPIDIAAADLDGDGDVDLVALNQNSSSISVLRNDGGVLQPAVSFFVGATPSTLRIADLDGNGLPDIVTTHPNSNSISILLNQGNATFSAPTSILPGHRPQFVLNLDLDHDGDQDLIVAQLVQPISGAITFLRNQGDGSFVVDGEMSVAIIPWFMTAADLDGDGVPELITSDGKVAVLKGFANGTFGPPVVYPVGPRSIGVTVGDFDGDGDEDIASADTGGISILWNLGDGTFPVPPELSTSTKPSHVASGDWNGDGLIDFAITMTSGNHVAVLMNQGGATYAPPVSYPTGQNPGFIVGADLNNDGHPDLCVLEETPQHSVRILLNLGDGTFGPSANYDAPFGPAQAVPADLDGDGDLDIAVANTTGNSVTLLTNLGDGTFSLAATLPTGPSSSIAAADFDGDGDVDLAVGCNGPGHVLIFTNHGNGTFDAPRSLPIASGASSMAIADVDHDGYADIAVSGYGISVLHNAAGKGFDPAVSYAVSGTALSLLSADVNQDGYADLITPNAESDICAVLLNAGNGTFLPEAQYQVGQHPTVLKGADLDGDGDGDWIVINDAGLALVRNASTSGTGFCFGDGSGTNCPCGNDSSAGERAGCLNTLGTGGVLRGTDRATLSSDHLEIEGSQVPDSCGLFFQGTSAVAGGTGAVFGDGLRCVGGVVIRLATKTIAGHSARYPEAGDPHLSLRGNVTTPGTRLYQFWYRNCGDFCRPENFNLTNGLSVIWRP